MKWILVLFVLNTQQPLEQHFFAFKGVETHAECLALSKEVVTNMPKDKDLIVFSECTEIKKIVLDN